MEKLNLEEDVSGVVRSISDSPPTHYSLELQVFSLLRERFSENGYQSKEFKAGGYKWKLVFHPNGNKKRSVKDHISLYLVIVGTADDSLDSSNWEVYVDFRLFLLNQNKLNYLVFEDAFTRKTCIHGAMRSVGFDKLIPLEEFSDVSNGFLVDDTCVFGAEVFVCKERRTSKGECLERVKEAPNVSRHVCRVEKFSKLGAGVFHCEPFTAGGYNWKITLYPKGSDKGKGSHLSLFLEYDGGLPTGSEALVEYKLSILDQVHHRHQRSSSTNHWFAQSGDSKSSGWPKFIKRETFRQRDNGLLENDACLLEAEVTVLAISKAL